MHVVVYCNLRLTQEMEKYSIKTVQKELALEMQEENIKLGNAVAEYCQSSNVMPIIPREDMVPYKHHLLSIHTVKVFGFSEHYGQQKPVVKLEDGGLYQAGENLEEQEEQLTGDCRIVILKLNLCVSTRRKYAICKSG